MYSNSIKSVLQSYSRLKIQHEGCIDQIRINLLDPDFRFLSWKQIAGMDPLGLSVGQYWVLDTPSSIGK